MIDVPAEQVWLAPGATDMRKSIDALVVMARYVVGQDPLGSHVFVFCGRKRDRIKILFWDRKRYGCMAHARRKFFEAAEGIPEGAKDSSMAGKALEFIGRLYAIEKESRDLSHERRGLVRRARAAPILADFHTWLLELHRGIARKGLLGRAVGYALDEWPRLTGTFTGADIPNLEKADTFPTGLTLRNPAPLCSPVTHP